MALTQASAEILERMMERTANEYERLLKIEAIALQHPEWAKQAPELKELLENNLAAVLKAVA